MHSQSSSRKRAAAGRRPMPEPRPRVSKVTGKITSYQVWSPTFYRDGKAVKVAIGAETVEKLRDAYDQWFLDNPDPSLANQASEMATVLEFGQWYLDEVLETMVLAGERSPATLANYRVAFSKHVCHKDYGCSWLRLGTKGQPDQRLNDENLKAWVRRMIKAGVPRPTQVAAIKFMHALGKAMIEHPSRSGMRVNPAEHLKYPKGASKTRQGVKQYVSDPDVTRRLIEACNTVLPPAMCALWNVATVLGLRRGELVGLQWSDFDVEPGWVHIRRQGQHAGKANHVRQPKGEHDEEVTLRRRQVDPDLAAVLATQKAAQNEARLRRGPKWGHDRFHRNGGRQAGDWVFTLDGLMMAPSTLDLLFRRIREAAGAEHMTLHKGRHDMISTLVHLGVPPDQVSDRARHKDKQTLFKYYLHATAAESQAADKLQAFMAALRQSEQAA